MSKVDWRKLQSLILDRIKQQPKDYPVKNLIPVADEVLNARAVLIEGVSKLLKVVPLKACRWCPEIHVGHIGHRIRTCRSYERGAKNVEHEWMEGSINDILIPVESFHLRNRFQTVIEHDEMLEYDRIPAIIELCIQAGAEIPEYLAKKTDNSFSENALTYNFSDNTRDKVRQVLVNEERSQFSSPLLEELSDLARRTLYAWETMRLGAQRLMHVYPVKVCQFCPEVHVGPIGHKVQRCSLYKKVLKEHKWKHANLDDLIPPRNVWHLRQQDAPPLLHKGRGYYGHAPAVVELCVQAGSGIPKKYICMMKIYGLRPPSNYLCFLCFVFLLCAYPVV
ncbi:APO protein 4, mitochondrial [Cryptomeria japonica]|uniref:APO protein 4, mitochondrial n=1 Tax=Cryptomeria japonica TaxID=3369 RepID=UPI0027D9CEE0|nr:APO protein 4, mitochondrial [Cryptomeria japonica]XP_059076044.1 APO protein 4, mitochondrial [Cryptomeria japonica]XP_059076045.1 APO protein 4, mitochondrial [Cryptomeria japonica]XP_059076047.1 APO protein 4, mitochondrial [Cryptomeria japonica]XP_059076048.1 APO protein 4, mitochondrial [Cryptomeria japonica]XP_059076049.1 APO protein 4, mitochondrial [Cryptomeria japonica]